MYSTGLLLSVVLAALLAGLQVSSAQDSAVTNCSAINADLGISTEQTDPITDPDLPVCEDLQNTPQCCSSSYILQRLDISEQQFLDGLRMELQDRFQDLYDLAATLRQYLEGEFSSSYFSSLGDFNFLNNASKLIDEFRSTFRNNIKFDPEDDDDDEEDGEEDSDSDDEEDTDANGFNVRRFLQQVVRRFEDSAVKQFAQNNTETGQCIREVIEGNIELSRMEEQAEAIQQIRRVLASIEFLQEFVQNFTRDLAGFRPLQECLNALVEVNTCGRCVAVRPPLCRNVCGAIARACYSSFNNAMRDEFELLWEVVRRILDAATDALGDLNKNRGILSVDPTTIVQEVVSRCGVNLGGGRVGKRQSDNNDDDDEGDDSTSGNRGIPLLPQIVRATARALRGGPFDYAGRLTRGPGLCRRLNTTRANCWDNKEERDNDIDEFDGDDIEDQVNNPVVDLDEEDLMEQAESLGKPFSNVLNGPSFAQVAPSALVLPGDENNGATQVAFSFTLFSALMLIAITFI